MTSIRVIVDTDCGTDDLLALAYLLSCPSVQIEAITTVHGLTRPIIGANNLLRVLARLNRPDIPVHVGESGSLCEVKTFPADWMMESESLLGLRLPPACRAVEVKSAVSFLSDRLCDSDPLTILALGPLTNIACALRRCEVNMSPFHVLAMGGAVDVPGNLQAGGVFDTANASAEWNFFVDAHAAHIVLGAALAQVTLVPLDATNSVPMRPSLLSALEAARSAEGLLAREVLRTVADWISEGHYFAWDPLAAVLLTHPSMAPKVHDNLAVETTGSLYGSVLRNPSARRVAYYRALSPDDFEREFVGTLAHSRS